MRQALQRRGVILNRSQRTETEGSSVRCVHLIETLSINSHCAGVMNDSLARVSCSKGEEAAGTRLLNRGLFQAQLFISLTHYYTLVYIHYHL